MFALRSLKVLKHLEMFPKVISTLIELYSQFTMEEKWERILTNDTMFHIPVEPQKKKQKNPQKNYCNNFRFVGASNIFNNL